VTADRSDRVSGDCERVSLPAGMSRNRWNG